MDGELYSTTVYSYDDLGNMTGWERTYADGSPTERAVCTWENGLNTRTDSYTGDEQTGYTLYEYDAHGYKIAAAGYNADGTLDSRWEYENDADGNVTASRRYDANGVISYESTTTYSANGIKTAGTYAGYENGVLDYTGEHTYDKTGRFSTYYKFYTVVDGKKTGGYREAWYDGNGRETKYVSCNSDGTIDYQYEHTYNNKGQRTREVYDSYENGELSRHELTTYAWAGNGSVTAT